MWVCATPATWYQGGCQVLYVKFVCVCVKVVCVCESIVCEIIYCMLSLCVWSYCMWEMVCDKVVCMWQSCVCVGKYCMLSLCVWSLCVKLLYVKDKVACVREAAGGGGTRDTESKTRTPHKVVGKNLVFFAKTTWDLCICVSMEMCHHQVSLGMERCKSWSSKRNHGWMSDSGKIWQNLGKWSPGFFWRSTRIYQWFPRP